MLARLLAPGSAKGAPVELALRPLELAEETLGAPGDDVHASNAGAAYGF